MSSSSLPYFTILLIMLSAICSTFGCNSVERKALLELRSSVRADHPSNRLISSWNNNTSDCCAWNRVKCDNVTGRPVIELDMTDVNLSQSKYLFQVLNRLPSLVKLILSSSGLDNTHLENSSCVNSSLLANIQHLDLSSNSFSGELPRCFLHNMASLTLLDLSDNEFSGEIPTSLGQLSNLEAIDISFNFFNGTLSEIHFANLSKLETLYLGRNSVNFNMGLDWVPPFRLKGLDTQSCEVGGRFPEWLQTQKELMYLDMTNCSISGTLPNWLRDLNNLTHLFLSKNQIEGPLPQLPSTMLLLDLSQNYIEGSITTQLPSTISFVDLSNNHINGTMPKLPSTISFLHLSNNRINGPIPKLANLTLDFLGLSDNMMNGSIPDSLCEIKALRTLDLSRNHFSGNFPNCWNNLQASCALEFLNLKNNHLTGELPTTLRNCKSLEVLDVRENRLSGDLPEWIGTHLPNLTVLVLGNNEFRGAIPSKFCQLFRLQVMDLANNKLTENIPQCFGSLLGMVKKLTNGSSSRDSWYDQSVSQIVKGVKLNYTTTLKYVVNLDLSSNNLVGEIPVGVTSLSGLMGLNLSRNHIGGNVPGNIGELNMLESLDLSSNNLVGTIPQSVSDLSFLSHLNFSTNNLSGRIPTGYRLQTLNDPSIYGGNPGLCGAPLLKKCPRDETFITNPNGGNQGDTSIFELIFSYEVIMSGFATGFLGVVGVLVLKRSWRQAYFQLIEVQMGKMFGL